MEMICYKRCSTCNKAKKFLIENNIDYNYREITEDILSENELKEIYRLSSLPIKKLFNTSGRVYRELKLKDKINDMKEEKIFELLSQNPMLIKRPILKSNDKVLIGFKEEVWKKELNI